MLLMRYVLPVLSSIILLVVVLFVPGEEGAPSAVAAPVEAPTFAAANWREQFAADVLARVGNERPSQEIINFIVEWTIAEDVGDGAFLRNNPLNTTQTSPDAEGSINDDGVKDYASYQGGLDATLQTLSYGYYTEIVASLQANDAEHARMALWASPWAASHYGYGADWQHYERAVQEPPPSPTTPGCPLAQCWQSGSGFSSGHPGIDLGATMGEPVHATIAGVAQTSTTWPCGNGVEVFAGDDSVLVCHLSGFAIADGTPVETGTLIGYAGSSGDSTGPHVHYEVRHSGVSIDPGL